MQHDRLRRARSSFVWRLCTRFSVCVPGAPKAAADAGALDGNPSVLFEEKFVTYSVDAYLISLDRLRAIYGCKDTALIDQIENLFGNDIAELNTWIEEDWDIPAPTINEVIRANIAGVFPWSYAEAHYKEVLQFFCKYSGKTLPNDMFTGLRPFGVCFVEEEEPHIGRLIFRTPPPVNISGIEAETMYRVGHITYEVATQMLAERSLSKVVLLPGNGDETWQVSAAAQFYGWLVAARQEQKAIVTFFL